LVKRLSWILVAPPLALVAVVLTWGRRIGPVPAVLVAVVLAVAVTVIEVTLILTLMASGGDKSAALARDTVFAAG
jgi:Ca2+:H+ antiporter